MGGMGGYLIYSWLWNVAGYELVEVSDQSLCIRRMALGFTCTRQYLTERVKDIRVALSPRSSWGWLTMMPRKSPRGSITFDHRAKAASKNNLHILKGFTRNFGLKTGSYSWMLPKTVRFGRGVSEAEAKQIVAEIKMAFPPLRGEAVRRNSV